LWDGAIAARINLAMEASVAGHSIRPYARRNFQVKHHRRSTHLEGTFNFIYGDRTTRTPFERVLGSAAAGYAEGRSSAM